MSEHACQACQPWGHTVTFTVYVPGPIENARAVSEGALFPASFDDGGVEVGARIDVVQNEPKGLETATPKGEASVSDNDVDRIVERLKHTQQGDPEEDHAAADEVLVQELERLAGDTEGRIREAFWQLDKWYA